MAAPARMRTALATGALLVAVAAACGAQPPAAEPTPRPTVTAALAPASPQPTSASATAVAGPTVRWRTDLEAGGRVGNAAPNATVTLPDGTRLTLEELAGGKPLLLYFFATWCPVCRAEFRTLKTVYPAHADEVAFVAVGFDTTESLSKLAAYRASSELPWTVAAAPREVAVQYGVRVQSTKFGIGRDGVVAWASGYGTSNAGVWDERLLQLRP